MRGFHDLAGYFAKLSKRLRSVNRRAERDEPGASGSRDPASLLPVASRRSGDGPNPEQTPDVVARAVLDAINKS